MRTALVIALATIASSPALAQPTEAEQRQACTGDVLRFCALDIPDRQKIGMCLMAHRDQITPACRGIIDAMSGRTPPKRG